MPAFGLGPDLAVIDRRNAEHGDARYSAGFVEGATGRTVDQTFVVHILQQGFQQDLLMP
jgi:hypothetical protein